MKSEGRNGYMKLVTHPSPTSPSVAREALPLNLSVRRILLDLHRLCRDRGHTGELYFLPFAFLAHTKEKFPNLHGTLSISCTFCN
jgi:hypothetical protein